MLAVSNRRRLVPVALVGFALCAHASPASAQATPIVPYPSDILVRTQDMAARGLDQSDFPRVKKLADNVYVFEALHQSIKTLLNNSLIVITNDGVLIAEGHGLPETVTQLVEAVRALTPQPIKYVVVASDHGDHTGGNAAFPATATFIAHPTSQATLQRQADTPPREGQPARKVIVPTETVADRRSLRMGGTEIQIMHLGRAHTGGDLMVYLPASKILWMSESFHHGVFPSVGGGFPSEWVAAIKRAEAMDVSIFAPAHGFVDSPQVLKEELANYRGALERLIAEGKRLKAAGLTAEEAAKQADLGPYASMYRYAENIGGAMTRVYLELDGKLPPPPAGTQGR